jgi:hypothetical protein
LALPAERQEKPERLLEPASPRELFAALEAARLLLLADAPAE